MKANRKQNAVKLTAVKLINRKQTLNMLTL